MLSTFINYRLQNAKVSSIKLKIFKRQSFFFFFSLSTRQLRTFETCLWKQNWPIQL